MSSGALLVITIILLGLVALCVGVMLVFAGNKFAVAVDPKESAVRECLPGNNCGACGYPGCDGLAAAIAKGEAPVNKCPVLLCGSGDPRQGRKALPGRMSRLRRVRCAVRF